MVLESVESSPSGSLECLPGIGDGRSPFSCAASGGGPNPRLRGRVFHGGLAVRRSKSAASSSPVHPLIKKLPGDLASWKKNTPGVGALIAALEYEWKEEGSSFTPLQRQVLLPVGSFSVSQLQAHVWNPMRAVQRLFNYLMSDGDLEAQKAVADFVSNKAVIERLFGRDRRQNDDSASFAIECIAQDSVTLVLKRVRAASAASQRVLDQLARDLADTRKQDIRWPEPFLRAVAGHVRRALRTVGKAPPIQRPKLVNEDRDKWMYEQAVNGVAYKSIRFGIKKQSSLWSQPEKRQGVWGAILAYAKRYDLPPPPKRRGASATDNED